MLPKVSALEEAARPANAVAAEIAMSDFLLILPKWIEEEPLKLRRVTVMEGPPLEHLALGKT